MKVLITGGAGYIGTEVAMELSKSNSISKIIIYDNLSRKNYNLFIGRLKLDKKVAFINADILDTRQLRKSLEGIDVVIHLAAIVTTPFSDTQPQIFEQINHWGTAELVYALEESSVKRFIHLSSASVYGASSEEMDTCSVLNPRTFYGISKMRAESHVKRLLDKEIETFILRCGNVYGYSKSMRFDSVINKFMFDANFKGRISINGDGKQHRSFIHIDKTANIISKITLGALNPGIYDLVEDTFDINRIADTLKDIFPKLEMIYVNQNFKLRELKVKPNKTINSLTDIGVRTLKQVLSEFKNEFTF